MTSGGAGWQDGSSQRNSTHISHPKHPPTFPRKFVMAHAVLSGHCTCVSQSLRPGQVYCDCCGRPLPEPTRTAPHTPERVAVMARRAVMRQCLWHPLDVGLGLKGMLLGAFDTRKNFIPSSAATEEADGLVEQQVLEDGTYGPAAEPVLRTTCKPRKPKVTAWKSRRWRKLETAEVIAARIAAAPEKYFEREPYLWD